ncbi:MAG: hypothetical protein K2Q12_11370 [Rickettsiales bacterium]|nr:hypothetical protein [Rickettsiales bacterium]
MASKAPAAHEAIELYCTFAAREMAVMLPALDGLNALIFYSIVVKMLVGDSAKYVSMIYRHSMTSSMGITYGA